MTYQPEKQNIKLVGALLTDIAVLLLSNGANSTRTSRNLHRIVAHFGYGVEHFFSHSAIVITLHNTSDGDVFTKTRSIPHYAVNYSIVSEISILSWKIADGKLSFSEIESEMRRIQNIKSYPEWVKILFVSFATAALSKMFDATPLEFLVCFLAAALGFLGRLLFIKKKFNVYICFLVGAFVSTSVVNVFRILGMQDFHAALTACVLWLIPGVPLINGFLDIVSGHIINGWAKVAMGFMLVFMIAVGFYISLFMFGYGYTV